MHLKNPIHHGDDPSSSVEAARDITDSGTRASHCALVLRVVREHPDSTSAELATHLDGIIDLTETRRRLTDLKEDGLIVQGEVRACKARGTRMVCWRAAVEREAVEAAAEVREIRTHQAELFR